MRSIAIDLTGRDSLTEQDYSQVGWMAHHYPIRPQSQPYTNHTNPRWIREGLFCVDSRSTRQECDQDPLIKEKLGRWASDCWGAFRMADSALRYADKSVPHPDFDKVAQDIAARLRDFNGIIESVNATITSFNHSCHKLLDGDMFSGVGAKGVYTPARATCLGVDDLTVLLQASRAFDSDTYGRRGDWKFCQSVLRDTASRYQPLDKRRIFQAYLAMDTIGSVRAPAIARSLSAVLVMVVVVVVLIAVAVLMVLMAMSFMVHRVVNFLIEPSQDPQREIIVYARE